MTRAGCDALGAFAPVEYKLREAQQPLSTFTSVPSPWIRGARGAEENSLKKSSLASAVTRLTQGLMRT